MTINPESRIIDRSLFSQMLGVKTVKYENGEVILHLPIEEKHKNGIETVHGGVIATMIDNIIGATITSIVNFPSTTINLNVQYISPITNGVLIAKANILHLGYRIVTGEGIITNKEVELIAKGTGSFKILRPKK